MKHKNTLKVIPIPLTASGELDYDKLQSNVQKITNEQKGYTGREYLICTDCNTILEQNIVFTNKKESAERT
ncbi:MAG: hypothetical protein KAS32_06160 [Candidatus Peribacteraceae bacterium]|nr:hypothetical protein [Candidatus Peribacteraceae bacterium]